VLKSIRAIFFITAVLTISVSAVTADVMRTHPAPGIGSYNVPFFPNGTYSDDVQSPSEFLGMELGSWPISHGDMFRYFTYLDQNLPNVRLTEYATSYEGRSLVYLTITSPERARDLEAMRANTALLADPRKLENDAAAKEIIQNHPVTAWMAYGIHGDELSSGDAAIQLAYQLVAGTDSTSRAIRDNVIVCIDPMENPDGRERYIKQLEMWNGVVPNTDVQSFHHQTRWPEGRGNHYLFDLNRDWFSLVHPETRGKIPAILDWNPQLVLDAHEMGRLDTYLFSPPREPFNPYWISQIHKWWEVFSRDQAAAFDHYGWSYYTREWNEEIFPGYGSSWGTFIGAIGMLYEQAGIDGSQIKRRDGTVITYRESIHHQFVSSVANIKTMSDRRQELLEDYYEEKKRAVGKARGSKTSAAFVFPPTTNKGRLHRFAETLQRQHVEVVEATEAFKIDRARSSARTEHRNLKLPAGSLIVNVSQPLRHLAQVILAFDIPLPSAFLETQRREVLKNNDSRLYEVTGWSMALAYNLESYYTESLDKVNTKPFDPALAPGRLLDTSPLYGYAIDGADDRSTVLLARLFENDYKVWAARKPFLIDGQRFEAGSLVIRRNANPHLDEDELRALADATGVDIYGVNTALGGELADFGGREFVLLQAPRVAIVGGSPISTYQFGAVWHLLDSRLAYKASTLNFNRVGRMDLRKYNVIVLPSATSYAGSKPYERMLGEDGIKRLKAWVESGGTLVAMDGAMAFLADSSTVFSKVRKKQQVLDKLADYDNALAWLKEADSPVVDSLALWEGKTEEKKEEGDKQPSLDLDALRRADELARRLRPRGVILAVDVDKEHWLSFGERSPVPLVVSTPYAYLAKTGAGPAGVQVAGRFADSTSVRLSGLLWTEARARWSETAAVSREPYGDGQIIMFAMQPNFRGYFHGGERMLLNAIFLGPGFGAKTPLEW